jgi:hypothetical protein
MMSLQLYSGLKITSSHFLQGLAFVSVVDNIVPIAIFVIKTSIIKTFFYAVAGLLAGNDLRSHLYHLLLYVCLVVTFDENIYSIN